MLAAADQVANAAWIAPGTSLPDLILALGKVSEVDKVIGIVFLGHLTCRLLERAGSNEDG
jgi:hypothetical protein